MNIAILLSSLYVNRTYPLPSASGPPGFSMLEVKGADKFPDSILVHTASVWVSSLDTSSRNDCLLNFLGTNPDPPIRANRCIYREA